jgi:putative CocE/NonD family hydrolase
MNDLHCQWYGWTMKDGEKPKFLKNRIAYFVAGENQWKYATSLDAIANEQRRLYLHSNGEANDAFRSGWMATAEPEDGPANDSYVYDPLDTRPGELELGDMRPDFIKITDQTGVLNLFGSGLVYHSEPFTEDTEISGYPILVAWLELDVPDTDFDVRIYEILPDGTSIFLTMDMMRARYRESLREAKPVPEGEILRYEFDGFYWFSRRVAKGSRLRLVFKSSNSIDWQKNYNSGGVVAEESGDDARAAHVKLYHDSEHPSYLELPVVRD